ncbi:MAG: protein-glutamate O-methyltransferase family protein [Chloroflexi bacterium]|nr:protein-glutamate O-methyltransferase family protein [Chloroflexota bacterium]
MQNRPAPIRTDISNAFAHHTVSVRLPSIARETLRLNPDVEPETLEALAHDLETNAAIPHPSDPEWAGLFASHLGETWQNSEWFFAEFYFYRRLLDAVGWEQLRRDPFAPNKQEEFSGKAMRTAISVAFELSPADYRDRLIDRLIRSLWGNRIDLSMKHVMQHGAQGEDDEVLADDREAAVDLLMQKRGGTVHLIADNTGTELAMDLLLIDALLDAANEEDGVAEQVILHVKAHPTFVSDATRNDALTLLAELGGRGTITRGFGAQAADATERLQHALMEGRLTIRSDEFWNQPRFLFDLPPHLHELFSGAALVIQKGDANYRRAVGDAIWEVSTPFEAVTSYFPAPLLALRTLKSDAVVGLSTGQAEALDKHDAQWRVNGRRGVIQLGGQR